MLSLPPTVRHKAVEGIWAEIERDIKYVNISILAYYISVQPQ